MTFYENRQRFENISIRIGAAFSKLGLSPNQWTMLTIIPALLALYFLVNSQFLYAAIFFIISGFLDMVDGAVARVMGKVTKLGAYLDTMMDRYVEAVIILGLLFVPLPGFVIPATAWLFLYFMGSMLTTYAKSAAKEKELVERELKGGILERAERLLILFVGILLAIVDVTYLTYVIVLLAILTNISAIQRAYIAMKAAGKKAIS
ncbi:MAG: CDP-alcohol phosphatidyltransferase family protein [Candidatus Aenigmarchaeota archaeon]|nr:CDP-alcohol phosphatidyltransferase family protein [Candidatus Aenigmarchaeota archaeon]